MTDGRTLIEAFQEDVLNDPDFVRAIDDASTLRGIRGEPSLAWLMRQGLFPSPSALWPVEIDVIDLGLAWFGNDPVIMPNGELFRRRSDDAPIMDAASAEAMLGRAYELAGEVVAVWNRFIAPLRSGAVKAIGVPRGNALPEVLRSVWQRPATLVDGITGSIARLDDPDEAEIVMEWTAVEFLEDAVPKNKGGRRPELSYSKAMLKVLADIDRKGSFPMNGAALCKMIEDEIQSMGERRPDRRTTEKWVGQRDQSLWKYLTR